ncbi:MAG TPA: tetratricopeptide repeat protein [Clostridia bacterium]|nr:tetratricopeptide repeat protein [Clostridia bacterium]
MDRDDLAFVEYALQHPAAGDLIAAVRNSGVSPADLGRACMSAADILWADNRLEPALILWEEATRHLDPERQQLQLARCEANMGAGWADRGNAARAAPHAQRGLVLATRLGAWDLVFICASNLGTIAFTREDYPEARRLHSLGLEAAEHTGETAWMAGCLVGLAFDEGAMGDLESARSHLQKALPFARERGDRRLLFTCQRALAHIHLLLRDYPATVQAVLEAISLAEDLGLADAAGELYGELGSAYARQGDIARSQSAYEHSIRAQEAAKQSPPPAGRPDDVQ